MTFTAWTLEKEGTINQHAIILPKNYDPNLYLSFFVVGEVQFSFLFSVFPSFFLYFLVSGIPILCDS